MNIKATINSKIWLKQLALWMIFPVGQANPRVWVKVFVNPFVIKRGRRARIRRSARIDILPSNKFVLGDNSTIEDFCTINNGVGNVLIGSRTRIGLGSVLIGPVNIGNDIRLAQNIVVSGLNHNYEDITRPIHEQGVQTNEVIIEDGSWIGANAVILPGVVIGKNSVVAAGSIVTKDVPPYSVAGGNPARILKKFNHSTQNWERI